MANDIQTINFTGSQFNNAGVASEVRIIRPDGNMETVSTLAITDTLNTALGKVVSEINNDGTTRATLSTNYNAGNSNPAAVLNLGRGEGNNFAVGNTFTLTDSGGTSYTFTVTTVNDNNIQVMEQGNINVTIPAGTPLIAPANYTASIATGTSTATNDQNIVTTNTGTRWTFSGTDTEQLAAATAFRDAINNAPPATQFTITAGSFTDTFTQDDINGSASLTEGSDGLRSGSVSINWISPFGTIFPTYSGTTTPGNMTISAPGAANGITITYSAAPNPTNLWCITPINNTIEIGTEPGARVRRNPNGEGGRRFSSGSTGAVPEFQNAYVIANQPNGNNGVFSLNADRSGQRYRITNAAFFPRFIRYDFDLVYEGGSMHGEAIPDSVIGTNFISTYNFNQGYGANLNFQSVGTSTLITPTFTLTSNPSTTNNTSGSAQVGDAFSESPYNSEIRIATHIRGLRNFRALDTTSTHLRVTRTDNTFVDFEIIPSGSQVDGFSDGDTPPRVLNFSGTQSINNRSSIAVSGEGYNFGTTSTYSFIKAPSIDETAPNNTATFTLTTTGIPDNKILDYTISGTNIEAAGLQSNSLTGQFTISNNVGTATVVAIPDLNTEGDESFRITLDDITPAIQSESVTIRDTSTAFVQTFPFGGSTFRTTGNASTVSVIQPDGTSHSVMGITTTNSFADNLAEVVRTINNITGATWTAASTTSGNGGNIVITYNRGTTTLPSNFWGINVDNGDLGISYVNHTAPGALFNQRVNSITANSFRLQDLDQNAAPYYPTTGGFFKLGDANANTDNLYSYTSAALNNGRWGLNGIMRIRGLEFNTTNFVSGTTRVSPVQEVSPVVFSSPTSAQLASPTYSLAANPTSVDEGQSTVITLTTTAVANGTLVPYSISGINADDISGSLSGNFTVSGNTATVTIATVADSMTDGDEIATLSLSGSGRSESVMFTLRDTSTTPVPTYSLAIAPTSVNEGATAVATLTTTNVADNTSFDYAISGTNVVAADITGDLTGTVSVTGGTGTFNIVLATNDVSNDAKTFNINISDSGSTVVRANASFTSVDATPVYSLAANPTAIDEGQSTTLTLSVTNPPSGLTSAYYRIVGLDPADVSGGTLAGSFSVANGSGDFSVTTIADSLTEGNVTGTVNIFADSTSTDLLATRSFTLRDTSTTPITYTLTRSASEVNEGQSVTITLTTNGLNDGTTVPYSVTGIADGDIATDTSAPLVGNFTIMNDAASITFNISEDLSTEGRETGTVTLTGSGRTESITFGIVDSSVETVNPNPIDTTNGSAININDGMMREFTGPITGSGTITKTGTGTVVLNGDASTFTGTIAINGGTVQFADASNLGGVTSITLADTTTLMSTNTGTVNIPTTTTISAAGTSTIQANGHLEIESPIAGSGSTIRITTASGMNGAVRLRAPNNVIGNVDVQDGASFRINDPIAPHQRTMLTGDVSVRSGGEIAGKGGVSGDITVQSGGFFLPAAERNTTLIVRGDLTLESGSLTYISFDESNNDMATVEGNATINGTLVLIPFSTNTAAFNRNIISVSGDSNTVTGTYSNTIDFKDSPAVPGNGIDNLPDDEYPTVGYTNTAVTITRT